MTVASEPITRWREVLVREMLPRTSRITSLFFDNTLGGFEPGQHIDLRLVAEDGYEARRSYSIASAPDDPRVELMVERLDDGEVSPFLHDVLRPDDTIEWRGPIGGHFVWTRELGGPLLLVAGGSGIAPLMSMLRDRTRHATDVDTLLVYSARTWDDLTYRDELMEMAERDARFICVIATSREPARRPEDFARRVDREAFRIALERWSRAPKLAYVCGSTGFVETVTGALVAEGMRPSIIRAERYGGI